jgi:hypothetical protein
MNAPYDQGQVDERFEALIKHCHRLGHHKLAAHYEKAVGMQRVHAIRFLEAVFIIRQYNERRIIRAMTGTVFALLVFALVIALWAKGVL